MANSYHTVNYRRFNPPADNQQSLERLCRSALGHKDASGAPLWQRALDRFCTLAEGDGKQIMLNRVADLASAVFGEMCLVQQNGLQAFIALTAGKVQLSNITVAEIFRLEEHGAPQGSQFIRGMVYWLCIGNHLFFVKTQSMTGEHLRQYLDWLLKERTGVLPASSAVELQAEFDRSQVGDDIGEIKSVRVSGRAATLAVTAVDEGAEHPIHVATARRIADKIVEFAQAVPIVEALLGPHRTESLVNSLGPEEYLAVDASVKVRGRRTEKSRERMRGLANELADLTDGKVLVEGKDGKVSDDDAILRTRMPFALAQEGSNFLDFDNVADRLQEVYSRFVQDGKISS